MVEKPWRPRKSLGQNFLVSDAIARRIVELADIEGERVLEIGPGRGALTHFLCESAQEVYAVEVDPVVAAELPALVDAQNLTVILDDILETDLTTIASAAGVERLPIIANLPYVISSRVLVHLFQNLDAVSRVTFMVQLEVGERILSPPGSRVYGLMSVLMQAAGTLKRGFRVPPGAFRPRPKVHSVVINWHVNETHDYDPKVLLTLVRAAFNQRRKRIGNALRKLSGVSQEELDNAFRVADIDPGRRAEQLSAAEFVTLSKAIFPSGGTG
jgi:16S rRNA (adenine1518-N6/adenine1519-N6)-dimethyltransferase